MIVMEKVIVFKVFASATMVTMELLVRMQSVLMAVTQKRENVSMGLVFANRDGLALIVNEKLVQIAVQDMDSAHLLESVNAFADLEDPIAPIEHARITVPATDSVKTETVSVIKVGKVEIVLLVIVWITVIQEEFVSVAVVAAVCQDSQENHAKRLFAKITARIMELAIK